MKSLQEQLSAYGAYHRDWRNKITHFVGVPLVTFALFLFLSWFRFAPAPDLPLTGATLLYLIVSLYYLRLDWSIALLQALVTLPLLGLADRSALLPFPTSLLIFGAAFGGGWVIQIMGHVFEGRRPALMENLLQVFNAPLFLTVEAVTALGFRAELRRERGREGLLPVEHAGAAQSDHQ
jgi:uncharacterized membrane protein YGL010W